MTDREDLLALADEIEHADPPTPHAWARRLRELAAESRRRRNLADLPAPIPGDLIDPRDGGRNDR
jgi:hypothetical protein